LGREEKKGGDKIALFRVKVSDEGKNCSPVKRGGRGRSLYFVKELEGGGPLKELSSRKRYQKGGSGGFGWIGGPEPRLLQESSSN